MQIRFCTSILWLSGCVALLFSSNVAFADRAVSITVSNQVVGKTPGIVGYNAGHFYPGSNTADWWRYSGVNGVRIFLSPTKIEPPGKDDSGPWGDGVKNSTTFAARRKALRAAPTNPTYNNLAYFRSQLKNVTLSGNRIRVAYMMDELKKLGVQGLAMIGRTVSRYPFSVSKPWPDRWEHWQHHYAMAYVLASDYGLVRHQIYNEPNHSSNSNLSQAHYITRMRFASDAIQSAIADVNRDKKLKLVAQVQSPVTAGGGPRDFSSNGWGTLLLNNLNLTLFGQKDPNYFLAQTYAFHCYDKTGPDFGRNIAGVRSKLAKVIKGQRMPVAITEFNVHTHSTFLTLKETMDSPSKSSRLGSIFANIINTFPEELYVFKFAQTSLTSTTVKKNGTHYVANDAAPYNIGGVTRGGEVVRLFAKGFKNARPVFQIPTASGPGAKEIRLGAARDPQKRIHYLWSTNTSGGINLAITLDLKNWGVGKGSIVQVEEVSESSRGEVKHLVTMTSSVIKLRQPPQSVWLISVLQAQNRKRVALTASEDATLRAGSYIAKNEGTSKTLRVQHHKSIPDDRQAAILKFNLKGIKASDIEHAVLQVNASNTGNKNPMVGHVYGLSHDKWTEKTITWNNLSVLKKTSGVADKIKHNVVQGAGSLAFILGHLTAKATSQNLRLDLTDFVRQQSDGQVSLLIAREIRFDGDADNSGILSINSKESTIPPQLILTLRAGVSPPQEKPIREPGVESNQELVQDVAKEQTQESNKETNSEFQKESYLDANPPERTQEKFKEEKTRPTEHVGEKTPPSETAQERQDAGSTESKPSVEKEGRLQSDDLNTEKKKQIDSTVTKESSTTENEENTDGVSGTSPSGCGCNQSLTPHSMWLALLFFLLCLRRNDTTISKKPKTNELH